MGWLVSMAFEMGWTSSCWLAGGLVATHDRRIRHRPLCSPSNTVVQTAFICIIASVCICQEQGVDVTPFQQLCQVDPVGEVAFCGGFIFRVLGGFVMLVVEIWEVEGKPEGGRGEGDVCTCLPLAGGQMAYGGHVEGVE